jgi:hypothetical protein
MTQSPNESEAVLALRLQITRAFPDFTFNGPITGVDGLMNEELDEERALYAALRDKKWSEVPTSVIDNNPDGVVLLTVEAFAAFLPAWLDCALTHEKVRELMVYVFSPDVHKSTERTDKRIGHLTSQQKETLLAFLTYCLEVESSKFVKERARSAVEYAARFTGQ